MFIFGNIDQLFLLSSYIDNGVLILTGLICNYELIKQFIRLHRRVERDRENPNVFYKYIRPQDIYDQIIFSVCMVPFWPLIYVMIIAVLWKLTLPAYILYRMFGSLYDNIDIIAKKSAVMLATPKVPVIEKITFCLVLVIDEIIEGILHGRKK